MAFVLVLVVVLVLDKPPFCLARVSIDAGIPAVPEEEAESNPMVGKRLLGRTFVEDEDEDDDEYEDDETGVA